MTLRSNQEELCQLMMHRFDPFFEVSRPTRRAYLGADVYRRGDSYYVDIDAPGVGLEDIDIEVEKKHLTVTVERREMADDERTEIVRGRPTGRFARRFFLGDGVDGEEIEASYDKGVLTLSIPVGETAKARKIAISAASNGEISDN